MLDIWRRELCFVTNLDPSKSHGAKGIIDESDKMLTPCSGSTIRPSRCQCCPNIRHC